MGVSHIHILGSDNAEDEDVGSNFERPPRGIGREAAAAGVSKGWMCELGFVSSTGRVVYYQVESLHHVVYLMKGYCYVFISKYYFSSEDI